MNCDAELCPNWTGQGCICAVLGLERAAAEPDEDEECCEDWDGLFSHYHCARCGQRCSRMAHWDSETGMFTCE